MGPIFVGTFFWGNDSIAKWLPAKESLFCRELWWCSLSSFASTEDQHLMLLPSKIETIFQAWIHSGGELMWLYPLGEH